MSYGKIENLILDISKFLGVNVFVLNDRNNLGKFDTKSDEGIFLGYFSNSKAYRVFNK